MTQDQVDEADLPTPRSTLQARYVRVMLTCWSCRHQRDANLEDADRRRAWRRAAGQAPLGSRKSEPPL